MAIKRYYRVHSRIDRGENAKPRYVGGYCHLFGLSRKDALAVAANERRNGRDQVRLEPCDVFGDALKQ